MSTSTPIAAPLGSIHQQVIEIMRYIRMGDWLHSGQHFDAFHMNGFGRGFGHRFGVRDEPSNLRIPFQEGRSRRAGDMFDALAKASGVAKITDQDAINVAALMFNPRLLASIEKPSILVQAVAAGLDPILVVELKIFHPEVQFAVLMSHDGAEIFEKYPEAFDLTSIEVTHQGITACVGAAVEGGGISARDRLEQFRLYGAANAETAQMLTVRHDPDAYRSMSKPSEAVQREMVTCRPRAIRLIDAPSEDIMRIAVTAEPALVEGLKNPPQSICQLAAGLNARLFRFVEEPSTELLLKALEVDTTNIKFMKDHPEFDTLVSAAAKGFHLTPTLKALIHMGRATEELRLAAVRKDGDAIQYIPKPSEAVKFAAVEQSPLAIWHLENPSLELQVLAMAKDPSALKMIKEPSIAARYLSLGHISGVKAWKANPVKFQIDAIDAAYPGIIECLLTAQGLELNNPAIVQMVKGFQETQRAMGAAPVAPQTAPAI